MTPPNNSTQVQPEVRKKTPSDFIFGKVIGEGSFSTVYLAKDVQTGKEVASKWPPALIPWPNQPICS